MFLPYHICVCVWGGGGGWNLIIKYNTKQFNSVFSATVVIYGRDFITNTLQCNDVTVGAFISHKVVTCGVTYVGAHQ